MTPLEALDRAIALLDRGFVGGFKAQAFGNEVALRLGIPAVWVGLYRSGQVGEVIFWHKDLPSCFRC